MDNQVAQTVTDQSFLQTLAIFMDEGGIFMWIILATWTFGIAIALERIKSLFSYDIDGNSLMNMIKKHVLNNDVEKAIQSCSNSKAILPMVLKSGLKRANQEKDQIQDAVDSTILEVTPKVDKRMSYLGLVANVSTLIGLLGTIYGLIESFAAVANADPSSKAKLLALGISKAMNTTAFGLISAISIMVIHNILSNKSEKIIAEIEEYSLKLVDLLGTKKRKMPPLPKSTSEAA
ncbi:putative motility membrane protein [Halobacteriovorax marinus SJ]|uniref:Motility membrane protein n=1 Tax=Halobacteriovorax marinus (strain ATCC BAA-682 / DSM 15412 / SJ) TaxID=862908 RepID=E1WZR1_HALMS|nr:MotA/TolQ/ExbB proton channel family protein [Halobacteriovorax marinus]CBW26247.1 putative motility membrane protein [Halobacteriovorax marinus SJ]